MIKRISPSWDFDEQQAHIVETVRNNVSRDWLKKSAACFSQVDFDTIPRDPKMAILHVIGVGDYESYSANRNADAFTKRGGRFELDEPKAGHPPFVDIEVGNVQTHPTFVQYGRVYRNHVNNDPGKSYGPIYKSAHNGRMGRIELLIGVPVDGFRDELEKIANGDQVVWSMSSRVPFDSCSVCGNKARREHEYCAHIKNAKTQLTKKGNVVCMLNDHMKYFDISRVAKQADRIAQTLRKVATATCESQEQADLLPIALGLKTPTYLLNSGNPRMAELHEQILKLAEIEKQVPMSVSEPEEAAFGRGDMHREDMDELREMIPDDVLDELSERRIVLSLPDLLRLVLKSDQAGSEAAKEAALCTPGMFGRILAEDRPEDIMPDLVEMPRRAKCAALAAGATFDRLESQFSLRQLPVRVRMARAVLGRSSVDGSVKTASEKIVIPSENVCRMVDIYARYQLEFLNKAGTDEELMRRVVMGNYVRRNSQAPQ